MLGIMTKKKNRDSRCSSGWTSIQITRSVTLPDLLKADFTPLFAALQNNSFGHTLAFCLTTSIYMPAT